MKTFITLSLLAFGLNAAALAEADAPPVKHGGIQTYTIKDGYGQYDGQGRTKIEAESDAREKCAESQFSAYENRHNGQTPDADTADLMIDACINK